MISFDCRTGSENVRDLVFQISAIVLGPSRRGGDREGEPDGYTIGLIQLGNLAINPHVYTDMTFDPLNDLVPVVPITSSAILVVANVNLFRLSTLSKRSC